MAEALTADAIKEIERLTLAGAKVQTIKVDGGRPDVQYFLDTHGGISSLGIDMPWHFELLSPAAFVGFVENWTKENAGHENKAIMLYDAEKLVFFPDEDDRQEQAVCELTPSQQWKWLTGNAAKPLPQDEMIRALRIDLRGCVGDAALLPTIRNLRFASESQAEIVHGRESMGRSVEINAAGAGVIPEEVTLTMPIWENVEHIATVACAVEIRPETKKIALTPYPLEIASAVQLGIEHVASWLVKDSLPKAFYGRP